MIDDTPMMGDDERRQSEQLSLDSLRPPLRVPGYEQERFLGRGSFGEVWVAIDSNSGRSVAIKYYNRRGDVDWAMLAREVEKLRHLFSDRHVVQLLAVGWNADPPYYIMEHMENGSLEDRLREGPMSVDEAVDMIREIATGLVQAHGKGILHCDLKPGNILLDQDRRPRLADFGQARLSHEQTPSLGTLFFMAPEQADLKGIPDAKWDVYALGALLYCMLTGTPPYREDESGGNDLLNAPTLEMRLANYRRLLKDSPRPTAHRRIPGMDSSLADIIDHCLAVNPHDRYPNVQAFLSALDMRAQKAARFPLLIMGSVAPALVLLVMALFGWWLFNQTMQTAEGEVKTQAMQGNHFAARAIAERFALEIDKRWRLLEREASNPELVRQLKQLLEANPTPESPDWQAQRVWFQTWLDTRCKGNDNLFSPATSATSWFVNDRAGIQLARTPEDKSIGKNWCHRDYFHGKKTEYPAGTSTKPIRGPHRSLVFRSSVTKKLTVAFSVPIWEKDPGVGEPLGILAMTSQLGRFAEWEGAPSQFAVLIDTLPVQTRAGEPGKPGMVIEHPILERRRENPETPWADSYVDEEVLRRSERMQEWKTRELLRRMRASDELTPRPPSSLEYEEDFEGGFRDPLEPEVEEWLVALEPVLVIHDRDTILDTGWTVLVEQKTADVLAPVEVLRGKLLTASIYSLLIILVLVGLLWWFVVLILDPASNSPLIRRIQRQLGLSPSGMRGSSISSGSIPHRTDHSTRSTTPPTVPSPDKPAGE